MSDTSDFRENPEDGKTPVRGAIIDATAHRRPRVHGICAEGAKRAEALDFFRDIILKVNVVLAETTMSVGDVLALGADSVVQLDKPSSDPLDIFLEGQKLGKAEVIVLQEKLRIRVLEITPLSPGARGTEADKPEGE
jgi:flagellar motor switch protein FliN/FliY